MPLRKFCRRHGKYTPGSPSIPGGRCPDCYQEHSSLREWRRRRKIKSGYDWGRLRELVHQRDRVCVVCNGTQALEVHHVIPLSEGGSNQLSNLELRCRTHHTHSRLT
jgi:5-methylcytosine-specific restriction endonuclease McrA